MTGFAYPEMMVDVWRAHAAGNMDRAHDLFDAYLPWRVTSSSPAPTSPFASMFWPSVASLHPRPYASRARRCRPPTLPMLSG
jgi:hypothetical protein